MKVKKVILCIADEAESSSQITKTILVDENKCKENWEPID